LFSDRAYAYATLLQGRRDVSLRKVSRLIGAAHRFDGLL
jgi:hypothetical protein